MSNVHSHSATAPPMWDGYELKRLSEIDRAQEKWERLLAQERYDTPQRQVIEKQK